jgi:SAM-dependent methyltransferase
MGPRSVLGIDHSAAAVAYARGLRAEFETENAEFARGDATALLVDDDSFDFVTCRLSLQIFSQPEAIIRELVRITRPGGRIYVTGEAYGEITAFPGEDAVRTTYRLAAEYGAMLGMDLRGGRNLGGMLAAGGLEDVRTEEIIADTANTPREALTTMFESWRAFSADSVGGEIALDDEDRAALLAGYDAQLRALRLPDGYANWVVVAASGRKPGGRGG